MKALLQLRRSILLMAVFACVVLASSVSALAQTNTSVQRTIVDGETHTGKCCSIWDVSVTINEPERIVPIVVTWSTDYRATAPFLAALSLNGGPCAFYGSTYLPTFVPPDDLTYSSRTFQWVILPGDYKLVRGKNVIQVCGGGFGTDADTDSVTLGFNTLTARLQK